MRGGLPLKAVLAVSAVLWCGAVRAEETLPSADALAPKETIAFLQTAPLGDVKDSLDAFGNAAVGMLYGQVSVMVDAFQGSDLGKAIDWKRPLGIAFLQPAEKGSEPRVVFYIPETAAGALQKAVQKALTGAGAGEGMEMMPVAGLLAGCSLQSKGGYVVCTEEGFKGNLAPGGKPWKATLKGTAVAIVDLDAIRQAFGTEIEAGIQQMEAGLGMMPVPQGGADPAKILKAELDLFRRLAEQSARTEVALDLSEARLALKTLLAPRAGTTFAKLVGAQQPGTGRATLAPLCGKGTCAAGELSWTLSGGLDPARILAPILEASGMASDAATQARLRTICAEGGHQAFVMSSEGEAPVSVTSIVSCADAKKAQGVLDSQCGIFESIKQGGISYKPVKGNAGEAVRAFEMVCKADGAPPEAAALLAAIYGKSPTCGLGASGDKVVCAFGGDGKARAARTIADLQKGAPGAVPGWYAKLTAGMPAGSQWRFGLGLLGLARFSGRTMEATAGMNPFAMLDKMALEESGLGVYGFSSKGGFEAGLVIPAESVALAQQLAAPLMMAGMGGGGMGEMPPQIEEIPEAPEETE